MVQSSVEEILFRGWLLSVVARKFNTLAAVALTSMVFALLHFSPGQAWLVTVNILLFSVFACCWALRAENIWGVMGWHAGWNWLLATGFELPVTGLDAGLPALLATLRPTGPAWITGGWAGTRGQHFLHRILPDGHRRDGLSRPRPSGLQRRWAGPLRRSA